MVINYRELCAYVEGRSVRVNELVNYILRSCGEAENPSTEALEQAGVEARLYIVEDFLQELGFNIESLTTAQAGQPAHAPIWKMLGYC